MSDIIDLPASVKERAGKEAARAARRAGTVPAVIYGGTDAPEMVTLELNGLLKILNQGGFLNRIFNLVVGGRQIKVIPKELTLHAVKEMPLHIDFQRLVPGGTISKKVHLEFVDKDKAPGLKLGGTLYEVAHEVFLRVPADNMPEKVTVSVAGLNINDSLHLSQVTLPAGCSPVNKKVDTTLATVIPVKE